MFKKIFNTDGKFTSSMGMSADLIIISALWTVCCIPIITIPLATAALYYAVTKSIRKGHGYAREEFLDFLKKNWKQGVGLGVLYLGMVLLVSYNYYAAGTMKQAAGLYSVYRLESIGLCILMLFLSVYLFPVYSRFQYSVFQHVKVAFLMSIRHIFSTVFWAVGTAGVGFVLLRFPILCLVLPALWMLVVSMGMERILKRYMKEPEEGEEIPWYWE
ncbi:MAG: DUF624 domain-containing protein [Hespellia sp.]|nr:DUF624 domain-containing protein [Hespellia sp.]